MSQAKLLRGSQVACVFAFAWLMVMPAIGEEGKSKRDGLHEPVYRVAKHPDPAKLEEKATSLAKEAVTRPTAASTRPKVDGVPLGDHPLDEALEIAHTALKHIDDNVRDYRCTLVKRERINGTLLPYEFMTCKIRHEQATGAPFSVYLGFKKPSSIKGREVIYVAGANDGKFIVHEGGFKGRLLPTVSLLPTSALAMRNQRYPITEIGLRTLTERLIEKGERDRALGPCNVRILRGAKVSGRSCTCIEVRHDDRKPELDFHIARVFVDDEHQLPIRYEAFEWPAQPGGKMQLIEEYTYMDLEINVGLANDDFDHKSSAYNF